MTVRTLLLALTLALAVAAPANAAEMTMDLGAAAGVRLGSPTTIAGQATENGAALAARTVRLEVKKHPFDGDWRAVKTAQTGPDGRYEFSLRLKRNHQLRVRLAGAPSPTPGAPPGPDTLSPRRFAYVLPAFTLSFKQRGRRAIRVTQRYSVPKAVTLTAPTRFYLGPCEPDARDECTAERAPFRAQSDTRRVRKGSYVARATIRIPASYEGRFSYVSCFAYSDGSGMGDPELRCPRRSVRLD